MISFALTSWPFHWRLLLQFQTNLHGCLTNETSNPPITWTNYLRFIPWIMQVKLSMQISYLHFRFKLNTRSSWLEKFTCGECFLFPVMLNNSFFLPIFYEASFEFDFESQSIFKSVQDFHFSPYLHRFKTMN